MAETTASIPGHCRHPWRLSSSGGLEGLALARYGNASVAAMTKTRTQVPEVQLVCCWFPAGIAAFTAANRQSARRWI